MIEKGDKIQLSRETEVISVPYGKTITLPAGEEVEVMQAKGSTVSIGHQGRLYMVEGSNLDALGLPALERPRLPAGASNQEIEDFAWEQLRTCFDPEIPVNIVDLGLVYGLKIVDLLDGRKMLNIRMTLTAPGCGMGEVIAADARRKIQGAEDLDQVNTEIVFDPPWSREMMTEEAQLELGIF
ncbi:putative Fe-S cluster assembly protein SufT [Marinospirillum perlucidum]|uniref:putative Fe-S cluster assembly protein SufT n=1 Tax=Marinospirillum perlucidum TaxID=1982602 RepID=UPI001FE3E8B5|nr:putative Fe-S cluster assembly protein SufT [Marinospirillum perlucidum]